MGAAAVPFATRCPGVCVQPRFGPMCRPAPASNRTTTPGSIVSVAWSHTRTSQVTWYGLEAADHVVLEVMSPQTTVSAFASTGSRQAPSSANCASRRIWSGGARCGLTTDLSGAGEGGGPGGGRSAAYRKPDKSKLGLADSSKVCEGSG